MFLWERTRAHARLLNYLRKGQNADPRRAVGEIIGRLLDPATSTVMLRRGSCPETWTAGDAPLYSNEVEPCCQLVKRHVPPFHLYLTEDKESDVEFLGFGNQSPQEMLITKHGDGGVSGKQVRAGALFFLVLLSPQAPPALFPRFERPAFGSRAAGFLLILGPYAWICAKILCSDLSGCGTRRAVGKLVNITSRRSRYAGACGGNTSGLFSKPLSGVRHSVADRPGHAVR